MKAGRPFACADPAVFEELVQDTYVRLCADGYKVLRTASSQHADGAFALVKTVAYTTAVSHFRSEAAKKRGGATRTISIQSLLEEIQSPESPENQLERTLLLDRIESILDEILPEKTRMRDKSAFWLRYRQGFTALEISHVAAIGLTEDGVESLMARIIRELRERMR